MDRLPEWITAIATAATAVAASAAGFIAWVSLRRDAAALPPIIEVSWAWPHEERTIYVAMVFRNRLYETLIIDSIRVVQPKKTTIQSEVPNGRGGTTTVPSTDTKREVKWPIGALGTERSMTQPGAVTYHWFELKPPSTWDGGWLVLQLRISSKALTIRDRRITIKRHIPTTPKTQTDAKASSAG